MTLRAKIVALVLGLTVLILAGLWLGLSRSWGVWSADAVDRELLSRSGALARSVELDDGEIEFEEHHAGDALRDPSYPYRILAPGGGAIASLGALPWPEPDAGAEPRFADVAGASGGTWRVVTRAFVIEDEHAREGRRGRELFPPATILVQVASEAAPFGALEESFRRGLLLALAAALLVGGAGAALLAHVSLSPLRRLEADVDAIGAASLDRRVRTDGLDPELRRVATAFNGLLARLDEAMGRQRQFVSRASHALRTPVATILTRAEVALRRDRDAAAYREALQEVADAARESAALVASLLTLSRIDEQGSAIAREDLPLRRVVEDAVRLLSPRALEAGVSLEAEVPDGLTGRANGPALRELLEALLDNALHHTPRGGSAGVRASPDGPARGPGGAPGFALTVWDSGPGIPREERDRVFERFYRGGGAQARPGSGLGLAIVKAIADAHGATVALSDRAGGGLEVTVRFPRS